MDVTPYPDPRHAPLGHGKKIKFLPDDTAAPVVVRGQPIPLPLRFFAVDDNPALKAYDVGTQSEGIRSLPQPRFASLT